MQTGLEKPLLKTNRLVAHDDPTFMSEKQFGESGLGVAREPLQSATPRSQPAVRQQSDAPQNLSERDRFVKEICDDIRGLGDILASHSGSGGLIKADAVDLMSSTGLEGPRKLKLRKADSTDRALKESDRVRHHASGIEGTICAVRPSGAVSIEWSQGDRSEHADASPFELVDAQAVSDSIVGSMGTIPTKPTPLVSL